ncbi:hypothetical protein FSARC_1967 [Fusarium sarcochroum]|uniref:Fungal N-terminal domain-containing protein n=1 Tax=Fusarium sarcochroum TaxID=1208366 RepID=A0A8H4XEG2_9HYPO|nr:hypothetical protein FSARC_1967 [Fusarium sarcochroum]
MEAVSAASAIASLLEISLSIIKSVRRASEAYVDAPNAISTVSNHLNDIQEILELVRAQPELQTDAIETELVRLQLALEQLQTFHRKLDTRAQKTGLRQFLLTLRDHDRESQEIELILRRIKALQESLTIRILIVNAGLVGNQKDGYQIACDTLERVDKNVKDVLGEGLRIRRVLEDRSLILAGRSEGFINLTGADTTAIDEAPARENPSRSQAEMERFVTKNLKAGDNLTYYEGDLGFDDQSTQGQRSIMEDIELGKGSSVIRGNVSKDASEAFIAGLWGRRS